MIQQNPMTILMNILQSGGNPQNMINSMVSRNPQIQAMINQAQQNGMTPKELVMQYSKQNNINLQPYMDMLRKNGIKIN